MAVVQSTVTTGNDVSGLTSSTTASVTPAANQIHLLAVSQRTGITADPTTPTVTGNGLTWVQLSTIVFDSTSSSRRRLTIFRSAGASPTTGAITISYGGQAQTDVLWHLNTFTGADTSGTNGSGAVAQSVSISDETGLYRSMTATLNPFLSASNVAFAVFAGTVTTEVRTAGIGFTINDSTASGTNMWMTNELGSPNDSTAEMNFSNASDQFGAVAVEIVSASVLPTVVQTLPQTIGRPFTPGKLPLVVWRDIQRVKNTVVASVGSALTLSLSDSTTPTDAVAKSVTSVRTDSTTPTDALAKTFTKRNTDTTTPTDAMAKTVTSVRADTTTPTDAVAKTVTSVRSDSTTPTDSFSRTVTFIRALSDTTTPSDALAKSVVHVIADTSTPTDATAKAVTHPLSDTTTPTDSLAKTVTVYRTDSTTPSDAIAKSFTSTRSDTTTPTDSLAKAITKVLSDTTALSDAILSAVILAVIRRNEYLTVQAQPSISLTITQKTTSLTITQQTTTLSISAHAPTSIGSTLQTIALTIKAPADISITVVQSVSNLTIKL